MPVTVYENEANVVECVECKNVHQFAEEDIRHSYDVSFGERYFYLHCPECVRNIDVENYINEEMRARLCQKFPL